MPVSVVREAVDGRASPSLLLGRKAGGRIALGLFVAALAILWLGRFTDIDLKLADAVFDTATGKFPWQHVWLAEAFNHHILKAILTAVALLTLVVAAFDAVRPLAAIGHDIRLRLRIVALAALLVPLTISMLKHESNSHCPWDLERYGGKQAYVRLFDALPAGVAPGHCLPAGHASSALWLVALTVFWLPCRPRKALGAAAAAMAFGFAVGWLQQLRGAHFLTHTLWSMWIACTLVFALVIILQWHDRAQRRRDEWRSAPPLAGYIPPRPGPG